VEQAEPKGVHSVPPQKPFAQSSEQQSVVSVQPLPSGRQSSGGTQAPLGHENPLQQSLADAQDSPVVWHALVPPPASEPREARAPHAGTTSAPRARSARAPQRRKPRWDDMERV
jgi:hypothetical protein